MAQCGCEVHSGRIQRWPHSRSKDASERSSLPQTVPICGSVWAVAIQARDEIRQQEHVGIEGQHPVAAGDRDRLVLGGCEADILFVVNDVAGSLEPL